MLAGLLGPAIAPLECHAKMQEAALAMFSDAMCCPAYINVGWGALRIHGHCSQMQCAAPPTVM